MYLTPPAECENPTGWVTAINLLGATQVAGGVQGAAVGKPNLDQMGPSKYWPLIPLQCFHPSKPDGAMVIMNEFVKQYWSKKLQC